MSQVYGYEHSEPITIQNIKDEQYSMPSSLWKHNLDDTMEKVFRMLQEKRWYQEHCKTLIEDFSFHWEDGKCWISSEYKYSINLLSSNEAELEIEEKNYITEDSKIKTKYTVYINADSTEYLKKIAIEFYYCKTYLEKLPSEIAVLEDTMAYLYSQM